MPVHLQLTNKNKWSSFFFKTKTGHSLIIYHIKNRKNQFIPKTPIAEHPQSLTTSSIHNRHKKLKVKIKNRKCVLVFLQSVAFPLDSILRPSPADSSKLQWPHFWRPKTGKRSPSSLAKRVTFPSKLQYLATSGEVCQGMASSVPALLSLSSHAGKMATSEYLC